MTVVMQFRRSRRRPQMEAPPQTLAQQVYDGAQNLAYELQQFQSGWGYFRPLNWFEAVIGDLFGVLNRLAFELRLNEYAKPTPVVGNQQWLSKLHKVQETVPRLQAVAELLKELFEPAQGYRNRPRSYWPPARRGRSCSASI